MSDMEPVQLRPRARAHARPRRWPDARTALPRRAVKLITARPVPRRTLFRQATQGEVGPVTTLATTITVALGAIDPLRLAGLSRMLEADPAFEVVGRDDADADVLVFAGDRVDSRVVPVLRRSSV